MDGYFAGYVLGNLHTHLFTEDLNNGVHISKTDITYTVFLGGLLQNIVNGIAFFRISRFFLQNQKQSAQKIQITIGCIHIRKRALGFDIRCNQPFFTIDAFTLFIRFDFRKAFPAGGEDVAAQRVKTANQRAGGMNTAALRFEKNTGSGFVPTQDRSIIAGIALNKVCRGQAQVSSQTRNFIRIHLNFLMPATLAAPVAGKRKRDFSMQACSAQRQFHNFILELHLVG